MSYKILTLLLLLSLSAPAHAQSFLNSDSNKKNQKQLSGGKINQYDPKYKTGPKTNPKATLDMPTGHLIPTDHGKIGFSRQSAAEAWTIHLTPPVMIHGCANIEYGIVESKFTGKKLEVTLPDPTMAINKKTQYPHYECDQSGSIPTTSITVTKEQLKENQTEQFIIKTGTVQSVWDIEQNDHYASFTPQNPGDQIRLWFLPANTVFLSIPSANKDDETYEHIKKYALSQGLIEITDVFEDFEYQQYDLDSMLFANTFIFVDQQNVFLNKIKSDELEYIDTIQIPETFVGVNGPYEIQKKADIYAAKFKPEE